MGILKNITDEYFGYTIREEDITAPEGVEITSFTDINGKRHSKGYRILFDKNEVKMKLALKKTITTILGKFGMKIDLSCIDVSNVTDMSLMFMGSPFDGNVSGWDVSKVKNMGGMFYGSNFTGKNGVFRLKEGNMVETMNGMFQCSKFDTNIDDWVVNQECDIIDMFDKTPMKENGNLPKWYTDKTE